MNKEIISIFYEFLEEVFDTYEYSCVKVMYSNHDDENIIHRISKDIKICHKDAFSLHERVVEKLNKILLTSEKLNYNKYILLNFYLSTLVCPKGKYAREKFVDFMRKLEININFFTVEVFYMLVFGKKDLKTIIDINREIKSYINQKEDIIIKNSEYTNRLKLILRDGRNMNNKKVKEVEVIKRKKYKISFNKSGKKYMYYSRKMGVEVEVDNKDIYKLLCLLENAEIVESYYAYPFKLQLNEVSIEPHLLLKMSDKKEIIIFLQDYKTMGTIRGRNERELVKKFSKENNFAYLICDGVYSYYYYKNYNKERKKEKEFLLALKEEEISWKDFKEICIKLDIDTRVLTSIILKNNLKYNTSPFFLSF